MYTNCKHDLKHRPKLLMNPPQNLPANKTLKGCLMMEASTAAGTLMLNPSL